MFIFLRFLDFQIFCFIRCNFMHFKMVIMSKLTFVLMVHTAILADEMGLGKTVQVFHATSGLLM